MAEPFLGEIRIMSFQWVPKAWAHCDGQLLPINQNQPLFALLGTTYGGDGRVNFALPDLRARTPLHRGNGFTLGERGGEQTHTLTAAEIPTHIHLVNATTNQATAGAPSNAAARVLAQSRGAALYANPSNFAAMAPEAITQAGGSQPHANMQPYLTLSFCIALQGVFPSPN